MRIPFCIEKIRKTLTSPEGFLIHRECVKFETQYFYFLLTGGNLYDKILRQKDTLFEEEVMKMLRDKGSLLLLYSLDWP